MSDDLGVNYTSPAVGGAAVTPSDTADLSRYARALWVGAAGNVKVTTVDESVITLVGVAAGSIVPVRCKRVWSTGTTATSLVALW